VPGHLEADMEWIASAWIADVMGKPAWVWLLFIGIVLALLVLDLGVLQRRVREIGVRQSLMLSAFYIGAGLAFGAWIWWSQGSTSGMEYMTGFLIEKSLSLDNVFVISLIFAYFSVPAQYQHRVLFWGILGVIVMRAIMIGLGAAIVSEFSWVLYLFGAFLLFTGVKMLLPSSGPPNIADSPVLKLARRWMRVTDEYHGNRFFVRLPEPGTGRVVRFATPLFLALLLVEAADLVFAVDSVPAIFAITTDPYIVYTSNIFAILGLRALYFALAAMVHRFHALKYALALVLVFIGGKIFWNQIFGKMDPAISLSVTMALLAGGILWSLLRPAPAPQPQPRAG
jgi:tellurite resistance protein TerC